MSARSGKRKQRKLRLPSKARIRDVQSKLQDWYQDHAREFPWRESSCSEYFLIISEILLQRTQAKTVADFLPFFIAKYGSWRSICDTSEEDLQNTLKPLGLWRQRASSLRKLSNEMVIREGRLPRSRSEVALLPGIGHYLTNAIMLLCHDQPSPLLDSSMARFLVRFFGKRTLVDFRYDMYLNDLGQKLVDCEDPREMNWAILDLSALLCVPRTPLCKECPLTRNCNFCPTENRVARSRHRRATDNSRLR